MQTTPQFHTKAGTIIGWHDQGVIRATGIPYARAERFQPPTPMPPSETPIMATSWAPACPQPSSSSMEALLGHSPLAHLEVDEHCQRLSITLPDDVTQVETLPVMVWIHGGSYTSGAGDATVFDTRALVSEQRVIVVSVTYRLGLFGFLGGYTNRAANLGLLDMIEAIRWIRTNIAAFGGDVSNITLFGHSAGGDAVAHLMIAEGSRGLFRRAIIQSAPLGISRQREGMTTAMSQASTGIGVQASFEEMIAHQDSLYPLVKRFGLKSGMPFGTQYGHSPLPKEEEIDKLWLQCAPQYDLLIGYTNEETALFLPGVPRAHRAARLPLVGRILKSMIVRVTSNRIYRKAAIAFARRHKLGGGKAYLYNLAWGSPTSGFGSAHTMDLPLLFGGQHTWQHSVLLKDIPWSEVQENGRKMRALWAQFARTGNLDEKGSIHPAVLHYRKL